MCVCVCVCVFECVCILYMFTVCMRLLHICISNKNHSSHPQLLWDLVNLLASTVSSMLCLAMSGMALPVLLGETMERLYVWADHVW